MRYVIAFAALMALFSAVPQKAEAATAYTAANINLRAGPAKNYPVIGRLGAREPVTVIGCTNGWVWCDVSVDGYRGWIGGRNLITPYRNRDSIIADIGSALGLPIVAYNERDYWGHYYYDRDFYRTRYGYHNDAGQWGWQQVNGKYVHGRDWHDSDHDGVPNRYDNDRDNDGVPNRYDHNDNSHHHHNWND